MSNVLVTGGSGFVGSHTILQLLEKGHEVRATVRNLRREPEVRAMLQQGGMDAGDRLTFAAADLERDDGWQDAVRGCDYVMHVASPFPATIPEDENELIIPAREGALRVLRAARDAGVRRVVMTSSFAAIGYGHPPQTTPFDESDWTDLNGSDVHAYVKSKTIAERAAWDFIENDGHGLELSVINPVGIFGPVLGGDLATSVAFVKQMMDGKMPVCPRIYFGVVDVRDVADLHLRAMESAAAKGQRFIAAAGDVVALIDVARVLRQRLGARAGKVPKVQLPDWLARLMARWNPALRNALPQLGVIRRVSNEKARRLLDWTPRSNEDAITATGESLAEL